MRRTSLGQVACEHERLVLRGTWPTMRRICGSNPMSSMRSASSRTRYETCCSWMRRISRKPFRRPGGGRHVRPASRSAAGPPGGAPYTHCQHHTTAPGHRTWAHALPPALPPARTLDTHCLPATRAARGCCRRLPVTKPLRAGQLTVLLMREERPNLTASSWICAVASSRVGARTSTEGPRGLTRRCCRCRKAGSRSAQGLA